MTVAYCLALIALGVVLSAPMWIEYGRRETLRDVERYQRRRLRETERR